MDNTFVPPLINDGVTKIAVQPSGKILILGNFSRINGITRNRFARLNPDGSLDLSFNAVFTANSSIATMLILPDGDILLGGSSIVVNGVTRSGLIRLNNDGSVDQSFTIQVGGFGNSVTAIVVTNDNKIYIAGTFSQINGINRNIIAKLEPDGTVIQSFNANISSGTINEIVTLSDGKIIIAGRFEIGSALIHLARLEGDGRVDNTFSADSRINNWVNGISLHPSGKIFVYGSFRDNNSGVERNVFLLNSNGSIDQPFTIVQGSIIEAFVRDDGKVYLVGEFSKINGAVHYSIARLNIDYTVDDTFTAYLVSRTFFDGSAISTLVFQSDGKILVGGAFDQVNGKPRKSLARLNADGSLDLSFNQNDVLYIGDAFPPRINAIALQSDGKILIAGSFTSIGG